MRHALLQFITIVGISLLAITEVLNLFESIKRPQLAVTWIVVLVGVIFSIRRSGYRMAFWRPQFDWFVVLCVMGCLTVAAITAFIAVVSPPNSTDAMSYHLPRVVYWIQQASVQFFPTAYLNQVMLQPFAEYAMLHLYLLAGSDVLVNLVQWFASVISIVAVSEAARLFGFTARGQALAALFCATLPSGILASSGAKNDYVLAMWMVVAVCFALRFTKTSDILDGIFLGSACGLAFLTKGTAYIFLPPLIASILITRWRPASRRALGAAAAVVALAIAINTPHFVRNYRLSGSILGFDSAHADGFFRWRNETVGWKQTVSNAVRHTSDQLGARSEAWNRGVYEAALWIHQRLGIDPNDAATTWRWSSFEQPKNANHEANAPNRIALYALLVIAACLAWRALHGKDVEKALYMAALLLGFLAFCAYLKWQPFMARLLLPLFVVAAPMAAMVSEIRLPKLSAAAPLFFCLLLLDYARLPLIQNWVRPLKGPASILRVPREEQYFADISFWNNVASYKQSADRIARSNCDNVGIDINIYHIEYPLMVLIREQQPSARFLHTGVANPSEKYRRPDEKPACVVACLDCLGDTKRLNLYEDFPKSDVFGRFVILLRE